MSGITMWVAAFAVTAAMAIGIANVGIAAIDDARAQTAADASALSGAAAGESAATRAAQLNGAQLESISVRGAVTTVIVRLGNTRAVAHAERILIPVG